MSTLTARTRSRPKTIDSIGWYNWTAYLPDGGTASYSRYPAIIDGFYPETINDYIDSSYRVDKASKKKLNIKFNPISHSRKTLDYSNSFNEWKWFRTLNSLPYEYHYSGEPEVVWTRMGLPDVACPPIPAIWSVSNIDLWEAIVRAEPTIEDVVGDFNLYTFVLELNKLKDLLGIFALKAHSVHTEVATKHLEYNFGVVPLLGDISSIYTIFQKLESAIDEWNSLAALGVVIDYHETISENTYSDSGSYPIPGHPWLAPYTYGNRDWSVDQTTKAIVHVYGRPVRIPNNMRYKAYIRALGLDKPISGLWEAVPFSWAIDYFTNVGDLVGKWEERLDSMFRIQVTSAGYSTKVKTTRTVSFTEQCDHPVLDIRDFTNEGTATEVLEQYIRTPLPVKSLFKDAKANLSVSLQAELSLGWKQASYLGAVAVLLTGSRKSPYPAKGT